jgi:cell division septum initiation protein DivIVA
MEMEQGSAPHGQVEATPIFSAGRRGYDPEQVDRYVADQQRRLDEAMRRASEAERKLAAAVGQLRELHRRVAVLESEDRSPQPPSLDTLGERVQRILQEAWEGAYALRQSAEHEANELREQARREAEEIVAAARRRASAVEEEIERRRRSYLERVEEDRARAVTQITFLHEQRKAALAELLGVKRLVEDAVARFETATSGAPRAEDARAEVPEVAAADERAGAQGTEESGAAERPVAVLRVQALDQPQPGHHLPDPGELVRSHRARLAAEGPPEPRAGEDGPSGSRLSVFDFDQE